MTAITLLAADSPHIIKISLTATTVGTLVILLVIYIAYESINRPLKRIRKNVQEIREDLRKTVQEP